MKNKILTLFLGFMPVSYTHLDVYKRQVVCNVCWIAKMQRKVELPEYPTEVAQGDRMLTETQSRWRRLRDLRETTIREMAGLRTRALDLTAPEDWARWLHTADALAWALGQGQDWWGSLAIPVPPAMPVSSYVIRRALAEMPQ